MIFKAELLEIAKLKRIQNIGYAEKDYLLELMLFLISTNTKDELVFKGGTALYKFYKFRRFSDDLDFSGIRRLDIELFIKRIVSGLSRFGIESEILKKKEPFNSVLLTFRIKRPLYDGRLVTSSSIRVDINKRSSVEIKPKRLRLSSLYSDIPGFEILLMEEKEILAEKIRAIITRNKARDMFDAFELLRKGTKLDIELVKKKMKYYNLKFSKLLLQKAINQKKILWKKEMKPLLGEIPSFEAAKKLLLSRIK